MTLSQYIRFQDISFTYSTMTAPLIEGLTVHLSQGWTGIIGANGVGKSTILKLATGRLKPQQGRVIGSNNAVYCRQRTDEAPPMLDDFIKSEDSVSCRIKGFLNIDVDWPARWDTLSHGERKRAQIAVAMWSQPRILAVDEPTNHLDMDARDLLYKALSSFKGIGLLVSHDRELLDRLCYQCLFVDPPEAILRHGNYTQGSKQALSDEEYAKNQHFIRKQAYIKLKKETAKRRDIAAQSHRRRSKRGLAIKDHDTRFKKNQARISGKDGTGGKLLNQLDGRLSRARSEMEKVKVKKKYEMGIWVSGSKSKRDSLFRLPKGKICLGGKRFLEFPDLVMYPDNRIALSGLNGGGKSSLILHILKSLDMPHDKLTYLPQEIDIESSKTVMSRVLDLPKGKIGRMMAVISRLGSRPHRLLESIEPSPGEIRKLLLAIGIANIPHLIIMDEPTNHLDLPSIECLEKALSGCPCGLLLISHDRPFLERLTDRRWHISQLMDSDDHFILQEL